jgi:hypothetical protein
MATAAAARTAANARRQVSSIIVAESVLKVIDEAGAGAVRTRPFTSSINYLAAPGLHT